MPKFLFADNARSTLAAPIGSGDVTIVLAPGQGALFPSPTAGQVFTLTLNDVTTRTLYECAYCTARSGDTLTVSRGQEGTTARSWATGDLCWNGPTAGTMNGMVQTVNMTDGSISPTFGSVTANSNLIVTGTSNLHGLVSIYAGLNAAGTINSAGPLNVNGLFTANSFANFNGLISAGAGINTAVGTTINSSGPLNVGGFLSAFSNVGVSGQLDVNGFVNTSTAFREAYGATGSGDGTRVTNLNDFPLFAAIYGSVRLPNGFILNWGSGVFPVDGTPRSFALGLANAFPNAAFMGMAGFNTNDAGGANWFGALPVPICSLGIINNGTININIGASGVSGSFGVTFFVIGY